MEKKYPKLDDYIYLNDLYLYGIQNLNSILQAKGYNQSRTFQRKKTRPLDENFTIIHHNEAVPRAILHSSKRSRGHIKIYKEFYMVKNREDYSFIDHPLTFLDINEIKNKLFFNKIEFPYHSEAEVERLNSYPKMKNIINKLLKIFNTIDDFKKKENLIDIDEFFISENKENQVPVLKAKIKFDLFNSISYPRVLNNFKYKYMAIFETKIIPDNDLFKFLFSKNKEEREFYFEKLLKNDFSDIEIQILKSFKNEIDKFEKNYLNQNKLFHLFEKILRDDSIFENDKNFKGLIELFYQPSALKTNLSSTRLFLLKFIKNILHEIANGLILNSPLLDFIMKKSFDIFDKEKINEIYADFSNKSKLLPSLTFVSNIDSNLNKLPFRQYVSNQFTDEYFTPEISFAFSNQIYKQFDYQLPFIISNPAFEFLYSEKMSAESNLKINQELLKNSVVFKKPSEIDVYNEYNDYSEYYCDAILDFNETNHIINGSLINGAFLNSVQNHFDIEISNGKIINKIMNNFYPYVFDIPSNDLKFLLKRKSLHKASTTGHTYNFLSTNAKINDTYFMNFVPESFELYDLDEKLKITEFKKLLKRNISNIKEKIKNPDILFEKIKSITEYFKDINELQKKSNDYLYFNLLILSIALNKRKIIKNEAFKEFIKVFEEYHNLEFNSNNVIDFKEFFTKIENLLNHYIPENEIENLEKLLSFLVENNFNFSFFSDLKNHLEKFFKLRSLNEIVSKKEVKNFEPYIQEIEEVDYKKFIKDQSKKLYYFAQEFISSPLIYGTDKLEIKYDKGTLYPYVSVLYPFSVSDKENTLNKLKIGELGVFGYAEFIIKNKNQELFKSDFYTNKNIHSLALQQPTIIDTEHTIYSKTNLYSYMELGGIKLYYIGVNSIFNKDYYKVIANFYKTYFSDYGYLFGLRAFSDSLSYYNDKIHKSFKNRKIYHIPINFYDTNVLNHFHDDMINLELFIKYLKKFVNKNFCLPNRRIEITGNIDLKFSYFRALLYIGRKSLNAMFDFINVTPEEFIAMTELFSPMFSKQFDCLLFRENSKLRDLSLEFFKDKSNFFIDIQYLQQWRKQGFIKSINFIDYISRNFETNIEPSKSLEDHMIKLINHKIKRIKNYKVNLVQSDKIDVNIDETIYPFI